MKFVARGALLLAPSAYSAAASGELTGVEPVDARPAGRVAVIRVHGPLQDHANLHCMSYETLRAQWSAACADGSITTLFLDVDSPGGVTSGCFSSVRDMRRMAKSAGKRTVAFLRNGLSASYAAAMACDEVYAADESMVGSIGVIHAVDDITRMQELQGVATHVISSGERKTDGSPYKPFDDTVQAALQEIVDTIASVFFDLVSEVRGIPTETIASFQGRQYPGVQAVGLGLVDSLMSIDQCLALVANGEQPPAGGKESSMDPEEKKALLAKLAKAVADGDMTEKEAREALGLAAEDDEKKDDSEAEGEDTSDDDEKKDDSEAEGEDTSDDEKKDDDTEAKKALSAANARIKALEAFVKGVEKRDAEATLKAEQDSLLAKRPDFTSEVVSTLRAGPIEALRDAVAKWPRMSSRVSSAQAALGANPTAGAGAVLGSMLPPDQAAELKARMGLVKTQLAVVDDGTRQVFGVRIPKESK